MKKLALIIVVSVAALVYLVAIWNGTRAAELADKLEARTAEGAQSHHEWSTERTWATAPRRHCRAIETLAGEGGATRSRASLGLARHAITTGGGNMPTVDQGDVEAAVRRGEGAALCRTTGTVDRFGPEQATMFDWQAHLDTVTLLAIDAQRAGADRCLDRATLVAAFSADAASGGSLEALSHATVELELANALLERCLRDASDDGLAAAWAKLARIVAEPPPAWRSLVGASLLVELGAMRAASDIRVFPSTPIELQRSIFTGRVFESWLLAIEARSTVADVARQDGLAEAATYWGEMFEDPDDAYEYALSVRPARVVEHYLSARERLEAKRVEVAEVLGERLYRSYRSEQVLGIFETSYAVETGL